MSTTSASEKIDYLVAALCTGFYGWMAYASKGFVEPDEMSHFMKSVDALHSWRYTLDIWGRPFCIMYYSMGAPWGITADRFLSIVASVITALGTIRLAYCFLPLLSNPIRRYRSLLWLLLFAQPYFMMQSFSVMTELLLACFWVWAAVAVMHQRWLIASLLIGLSGLTRPEGTIAVAAWPLALILSQGHFAVKLPTLLFSSLTAILPTFLWWLLGVYVFGGWNWFVANWPWAVESVYGKTPAEAVLAVLNATNFWMLLPIGLGVLFILKKGSEVLELKYQSIILLMVPVAGIFVLHFFLGVFGLFGSLSLPRYYITVAPFLAILAWLGIESVHTLFKKRIVFYCFLGLSLFLIPSRALYMIRRGELPYPKSCDQIKLGYMIQWFFENRDHLNLAADPNPENIVAAHPYVNYILSGSSNTPGSLRLFKPGGILSAPVGTVLIVENGVWNKNGFPSTDSLLRWGYKPIGNAVLHTQLTEACDNDPLYEDMMILTKQ